MYNCFNLALLAIFLQGAFANWCDLESCPTPDSHVDCTMANGQFGADCPDSAVMLNLANAQTAILKKLNGFRDKIAGGNFGDLEAASRMGLLRWNVSLANLCRKNVKKCTVPPDDFGYDDCRNTPDYDFVGQNQAYALIPKGETHNNLDVILQLIDVWNDQCKQVTPADLAVFPGVVGENGENIASCTQNLKGYASRVGCGALAWTDADENKMLKLCCNYDSGNVGGWLIYDAGDAGSKCKAKDTTYKNLCSAAEVFNVNEFWDDY